MKLLYIILLCCSQRLVVSFNDFPSLMTANATMVVVIEKTFYERKILSKETSVINGDAYDKSIASFTSAITKTARKRMNISGLSIHVSQDIGANLAKDYTILFSVATCPSTWTLFERAAKEKLVHLAITDFNCPRLPSDLGISIPLIDPGEELPQIFYDIRIVRGLVWKRSNILFDITFGQDSIGEVVQAFSHELPKTGIGHGSNSLFYLKRGKTDKATKKAIFDILSGFPPRQPIDDKFIVVVAHDLIPAILEVARSLKMLHAKSEWLFVVPDMAAFSRGNLTFLVEFLEEGENLAFLYNNTNLDMRSNESCHVGAACHAKELTAALGVALEKALSEEMELYDKVTEEEFDEAGMTKLVRAKNILNYLKDELYNDTKPGGRISTCGRCIKWSVASALTWGNSIGVDADIESHTLLETGVWTPDLGYESKDYIFPHAIHGFRGKSLQVVTYHNPPWQIKLTKTDENTQSSMTHWDGFIFDVFKELASRLNFTYKLLVIEAPSDVTMAHSDPLKASMSAAEKVPEQVTELVRQKSVFMAVCAYTVGIYRKDKSINLTLPVTIQTYGLLAPKPKPLSRALLFASPYSSEAWALLTSAILVVGPILYLVHAYSPRKNDEAIKNPHEPIYIGLGSPSRCTWYIYGALLQQGGMNLPKTDGARLIVGTWWLVVMVVVATYSGSLVAFLTFPKMEDAINNVDDILERREEFTWSLPEGSFLEDFLIVSSEEGVLDYRRLLQENDAHAQKHDTAAYQSNVHKVKNEKHVLIDWTSALKISSRNDHIATGKCYFALSTDVLMITEPIAMALPGDSPYRQIINDQLKRMHETGLINKWIANWMPARDICAEGMMGANVEAANHKVDLEDMQGIFFVLIFGFFIGTILLGYEFFRHHRQVTKEKKLIHPFLQ